MDRLKNYLDSRRLAVLYLNNAEQMIKKNEVSHAVVDILSAVRYLIVANNNLQSLAFHVKPKRRS